jgi:hypothetical protein
MLAGTTETALRQALPALAGHRVDGRLPLRATAACRRCAARHGQHDPVHVHLPAHQRFCERHRTWVGRMTSRRTGTSIITLSDCYYSESNRCFMNVTA